MRQDLPELGSVTGMHMKGPTTPGAAQYICAGRDTHDRNLEFFQDVLLQEGADIRRAQEIDEGNGPLLPGHLLHQPDRLLWLVLVVLVNQLERVSCDASGCVRLRDASSAALEIRLPIAAKGAGEGANLCNHQFICGTRAAENCHDH